MVLVETISIDPIEIFHKSILALVFLYIKTGICIPVGSLIIKAIFKYTTPRKQNLSHPRQLYAFICGVLMAGRI